MPDIQIKTQDSSVRLLVLYEGLLMRNEIYPVADSRTDIILYKRYIHTLNISMGILG